MPGEAFLLMTAQVGVVTASFAALVGGLRPSHASWTRFESFLLMSLITAGFGVFVGSVAGLVAFEFSHDPVLSVRVADATMLLPVLARLITGIRSGLLRAHHPIERVYSLNFATVAVLLIVNQWWASVPLLLLTITLALLNSGLNFIRWAIHVGQQQDDVQGAERPMRECPECLNRVPAAARRCGYCTAMLVSPGDGAATAGGAVTIPR